MGKHVYKRLNDDLKALLDLVMKFEEQFNQAGIFIAKKCPECGRVLPKEHYHQGKKARYGILNLQTYCKDCVKQKDTIRRQELKSRVSNPIQLVFEEPEPVKEQSVNDLFNRLRKMIGE